VIGRARRLRLGVVGCGRAFERGHLPALLRSADFELTAVYDPSPERVAVAVAAVPSVRVARDLPELIDAVDAVLVASPPATHREITTAVLAGGRGALVEKPMGASLGDARAIRAAATVSGRVLQVGFVRRFRSPYRRLRDLVSAQGFAHVSAVSSELAFSPRDWAPVTAYLGRAEGGGDALHDVATHQVDLLPFILGSAVRAVRVLARTSNAAGERIRYELELEGGLMVECEASHVGVYHERLWITTPRETFVTRAYGLERRAPGRALPSEGWLRVLDRAHLLAARLPGRVSVTEESFAAQLAIFARALGGERIADLPDADAGLRAHLVLAACERSARGPGSWELVGDAGEQG